MNSSEIEKHLSCSDSEGKRTLLSTLPPLQDAKLFGLVRSIAFDENEDDLCRIEAVKVVGLTGVNSPEMHMDAMQALLALGLKDHDPDVRNYALQQLVWFTEVPSLPGAVERLIYDDDILAAEAAFAIICSQPANPEASRILRALVDHPRFGASARRRLTPP